MTKLRRSGGTRWPAKALVAVVIGTLLVINPAPLVGVIVLFVLVVPFEKLFPRHPQRLRRPGLATDLGYGLAGRGLAVFGVIIGVALGGLSLLWVPGLLLRPVVALLPSPLKAVAAFLLFDALVYWAHRWSHEVPFLWRFHVIHHSSKQMDWVSGVRAHPLDGLVVAPVFVFLVAAGFSPKLSGAFVIVQFVVGLFLHANVRWRWRPLHRIIITPEFHHWHHADEADAHYRNYSTFLPVWDLLWGTYFMPAGRRPQVYGAGEFVPASLTAQLWLPLRGLPTPWSVMRHPRTALRRLRAGLRRGRQQILASTTRTRRPVSVGA
jgi:sterol desaturase/sphingolipid hydroxylase (fatty acid hydroxylase superfamily)